MSGLSIALPEGTPPADSYWRHEEPSGIGVGATRALARATAKDWTSGTVKARAQDIRDWLVFRSWVAGRLSGVAGAAGENQALVISVDYAAARAAVRVSERARAVAALGRTQAILAGEVPGFFGWTPPRMFATGPDGETAFPLIAIAIVTIVVAVAESAAVAYLAHQASQVADNFLARRADLAELVATDATLLRALDAHAERETAAGKALPLDQAEARALGALEDRQRAIVARKTPPVADGLSGNGGLPWWALPLGIAAAVGAAVAFSR